MVFDLYDFDKTVYKKDCSVEFWKYCLRRRPYLALLSPVQLLGVCLMRLRRTNRFGKTLMLSYVRFIDTDRFVKEFWQENRHLINEWFEPQNRKNPAVICSASPEFLIEGICSELEVYMTIGTKADKKSGRMLSNNCKRQEKIIRIKECFDLSETVFENAYTDAPKTDRPLLSLAQNAYHVVDGKCIKIDI
ncbi:MAG: haloacid dehalogenase-like hydrolase [Clostridia bacterium]|nr:haloacid dehalogenase-like hydrolase [Clostridia bacterium]